MGILSIIGGAFGLIGNIFKGIFSFKTAQADIVAKSLQLLSDVNASDADKANAAAIVMSADARSESLITRVWRPITVFIFLGLLVSFWFGYAPHNMLIDKMPPVLDRIFDIIESVVLAGQGGRTLEKIVREMSLGMLLRKFVEKKIL